MIFEHEFIDLANTAGISNVSTRGQPITSTLCKKRYKRINKKAQLVRILVLSNFLKRTMLMVDM